MVKNPYHKNTPSHSVWQNGYDSAVQNKRKRCPYGHSAWIEIWNSGWEKGLTERSDVIKINSKRREK